jgi:PhnB protein
MPFLTVKDADAALAFYQKAFGFEKKISMPGPDRKTSHAEMSWHDCVIMFGPESSQNPCKAPVTLGVPPRWFVHLC